MGLFVPILEGGKIMGARARVSHNHLAQCIKKSADSKKCSLPQTLYLKVCGPPGQENSIFAQIKAPCLLENELLCIFIKSGF